MLLQQPSRETSVQLAASEEQKLDPEGPARLREPALIEDRIVGQVRDRDKRIYVRESGPLLEPEESPELKIEISLAGGANFRLKDQLTFER